MTETVKPRRIWGRRILIVATAAVLLFFLVRAGVDLWAGRRAEAEEARLVQRYGSLDEASLRVPPVAAEDNRARAMRAATALMSGRHEMRPSFSKFIAGRGSVPVPTDLRAFVAANQAALRVVDDARARRQSNWEADYSTGSNVPPFLEVRDLSNAVYVALRISLEDGRPDLAATASASGLALAASLRQEPSIIAQLLRIAVGQLHFEGIQRLITQTDPSKVELEELSRWLAENGTTDPTRLGLLSELKHFNAAMSRVEAGLEVAPEGAAGVISSSWTHSWLARPMVRMTRLRYLEQMGHLLDLQTGARPRPPASLPDSRWFVLRQLTQGSGLERVMDTGDLYTSQLGLAELAIALRRYRIDNGQYPEALTALIPTYLPAVPIDPVTGEPPAYERQAAGFRLHAEKGKNVWSGNAAMLEWVVLK